MSRSWLILLMSILFLGGLNIMRADDTQQIASEKWQPDEYDNSHVRRKRGIDGISNTISVLSYEVMLLANVALQYYTGTSPSKSFLDNPRNENIRVDDMNVLKQIENETSVKSIEGLKDLIELEAIVKNTNVTNEPFSKGEIQIYISPQVATRLQTRTQALTKQAKSHCMINIRLLNYYHPLIIESENHEQLKYPQDDQGRIFFKSGESVFLSCTRSQFELFPYQFMTWYCFHGSIFSQQVSMDFYNIKCKNYQLPVFDDNYNEHKNNTDVESSNVKVLEKTQYYEVEGKEKKISFLTYVTKINDSKEIYYTRSVISKTITGGQFIDNNPRMLDGKISSKNHRKYTVFYNENRQNIAFQRQLQGTRNKICSNNDLIGRGQLTHKTSFVYEALSLVTLYYMNYSPQWLSIYRNNWAVISRHVNKMAGHMNKDLIVITGTHDNLEVKNRDNTGTKSLYLNYYQPDQLKSVGEVPVRMYFFKIVVEPKEKKGIVFVTVNNPYLKNAVLYELCNKPGFPKLKSPKGHTWDAKNVTFGYSYTCSVNNFFENSAYPIRDTATIGINTLLPVELN